MLPNITTSRLLLRCIDHADLNELFELVTLERFQDASVGCGFPASKIALGKWLSYRKHAHKRRTECCYSIIRKQEDELVGVIHVFPNKSSFELSFWLHPNSWGNGLMSEAITAVLNEWDKAFDDPLLTLIHSENLASQKLISKLPFECDLDQSDEYLCFRYKKSL